METFFLKSEIRIKVMHKLEHKIKINDWIATILALAGTIISAV
jgi:hypothetical protein